MEAIGANVEATYLSPEAEEEMSCTGALIERGRVFLLQHLTAGTGV